MSVGLVNRSLLDACHGHDAFVLRLLTTTRSDEKWLWSSVTGGWEKIEDHELGYVAGIELGMTMSNLNKKGVRVVLAALVGVPNIHAQRVEKIVPTCSQMDKEWVRVHTYCRPEAMVADNWRAEYMWSYTPAHDEVQTASSLEHWVPAWDVLGRTEI